MQQAANPASIPASMRAPDSEEIANIGETLPAWFIRAMRVKRAEGFSEIDGCPIHWMRWGNPENPPLVFLHGFMAHSKCWAFIAPLLAEKFDIIAFDFSGMGDSGRRDDYRLKNRIDETAAFVEAMNFHTKPFIIAHSYGGGVAVHAANIFPQAFRGLIVCDTMMLRPEDAEAFIKSGRGPSGRSAGQQKIYPDWETIHSRFRFSPEQECNHPFLFEYLAKHSAKKIDAGWTWKFDPNIMQRDEQEKHWWIENSDGFARLTLPKAILYGQKSLLFGPHISSYLRERTARDFPAIEIPDAHHHVMVDQPIALAAAIDGVLSAWVAGGA